MKRTARGTTSCSCRAARVLFGDVRGWAATPSLEAALRKACGSAADALSNGKFTAQDAAVRLVHLRRAARTCRRVVSSRRRGLCYCGEWVQPLTPRTDALRNSQKAFWWLPRHTAGIALSAGVVPNSSSFVGGLAELMARRKLTRGGSETVAQALMRARGSD